MQSQPEPEDAVYAVICSPAKPDVEEFGRRLCERHPMTFRFNGDAWLVRTAEDLADPNVCRQAFGQRLMAGVRIFELTQHGLTFMGEIGEPGCYFVSIAAVARAKP